MSSNQLLEVRVYKIHHGRRGEFADRMSTALVPLFKRHGVEVVHFGPSLHDEDSYFLMRSYRSVADRQSRLDALYGSAEWLMNHEEAVLGMIDTMDTAVLDAGEWLVEVLKERFQTQPTLREQAEQPIIRG